MPEIQDRTYTIDMIIGKILTDDRQYDISKLIAAYEYAAQCHKGQTRSSGEPYIVHPVAVAYILLELGMDTDTLCAALLHDVVEDTAATLEDVKKRFGHDVAMLVDGVTKLAKVPTFSKEHSRRLIPMVIVRTSRVCSKTTRSSARRSSSPSRRGSRSASVRWIS